MDDGQIEVDSIEPMSITNDSVSIPAARCMGPASPSAEVEHVDMGLSLDRVGRVRVAPSERRLMRAACLPAAIGR
jgi:hypothetical protein